MSTLAAAEKQLAKNPEAALEALLSVWRSTWHPGVSSLIERLGDSLPASPLDLPPKQRARAEQLAALVRSVPAAGRSTVVAAFREFAATAQGSKVWPSIEAWATIDPDPRVARMALEVLAGGEAVHFTAKLWRRLMNCVEHHGDTGMVDAARALAEQLPSGGWAGAYPARLTNVARKLEAARPARPVDDAALARLARAVPAAKARVATPRAPAKSRDGEALLAAICAAPDDDAPRLAYADWLTEHGDPRGEFIVLQIARARGKVSADAKKQEDELLRVHRRRFFGNLDKHLKLSSVRFERGFVAKGALTGRVPALPELALLEDVDVGSATLAKVSALVAVKRVRNASPEQAAAFAQSKTVRELELGRATVEELPRLASKTLEALTIAYSYSGAPQWLEAVVARGELPALEAFHVRCSDAPWGLESTGKPTPMFSAAVLRAWRVGLRVELELSAGVRVVLARGDDGFSKLELALGKWGNEYTQARIVAGAVASFVKQPVEVKVTLAKGHRVANPARRSLVESSLAPVLSGARALRFG